MNNGAGNEHYLASLLGETGLVLTLPRVKLAATDRKHIELNKASLL